MPCTAVKIRHATTKTGIAESINFLKGPQQFPLLCIYQDKWENYVHTKTYMNVHNNYIQNINTGNNPYIIPDKQVNKL